MTAAERLPPIDPDVAADVQLARRLRIAIALCVAPILLFALFDLALLRRDELPLYWALKAAGLVVIAVSVALLRHRRGPPHTRAMVVGIGLGCVAAMYAISTASSMLAGEARNTRILAVTVSLATATLLPWGVGPQLVVVLLGALSAAAAYHAADGSLHRLLQYPTVGMVAAMGVSVYVAAEFDRSRRALAARQEERRRAEAQVRRLNEELEARVAERTAELGRVNRELQAEVEERTRYATELRQSQAAASALIENADDAIWALDRDGHLLFGNAALRRRYAELAGGQFPPDGALPPAVREEHEAYWAPRYARGLAGERFRDQRVVDGADGRRTYINAFNPIVIDDRVAGLAVFSSEVTELRRTEEAVRQRQAELTHVQRLSTLGELAAGLAHEINQPLAAIVSYARGSARRLRGDAGDAAAVLPAIDSIATEALRAGEVIRRLRHLIRKGAARREWVDLNALIAEASQIVGPEARQARVLVEDYLAAGLPPVLGDGIQIEQVIVNLLHNAVEAMAGGGARRVLQLTTRVSRPGYVELTVRDTGPGLPASAAGTLFEPFVSTKAGGLGMGLSISRTIVQAHRGRIWATANHPECGATFRVELPVDGAVADNGVEADHAPDAGPAPTPLRDEPATRPAR